MTTYDADVIIAGAGMAGATLGLALASGGLTAILVDPAPFDAQLAPASKISGTVLQADGSPVDRYLVGQVFAADGSHIGDFDVYGGPDFTTSALPAGSFTLQLMDPGTGQSWWYDGATDRAHATAVPLGVGEQAKVTVHLP